MSWPRFKDVNEAHIALGEDFPRWWAERLAAARPAAEVIAEWDARDAAQQANARQRQQQPKVRSLMIVSLADVAPEEVPWLWRGWIAQSALTVVTGHPDVGKTWVTYCVAAAVTRGQPLFGDPTEREPGRVLSLGSEDPLKYVVRPRLDSLGADVSMVTAITGTVVEDGPEGYFSLATDLDLLDLELSRVRYELVIISPLNAYLGDIDTHRDAAVRSILNPLSALAEKHDVAIIAVIHPTKGKQDLPLYRIQGSVANSAACRTALVVGRDLGNDGESSPRRHVVLLKNNLMPDEDKPTPICFELTREHGFRWVGASDATKEDLLGGMDEEKSALDDALDFLRDILADGMVEVETVRKAARRADISDITLRRAKKALGVKARHPDIKGPWFWELQGDHSGPKVLKKKSERLGGVDDHLGGEHAGEAHDATRQNVQGDHDEHLGPAAGGLDQRGVDRAARPAARRSRVATIVRVEDGGHVSWRPEADGKPIRDCNRCGLHASWLIAAEHTRSHGYVVEVEE